VSQDKKNLLIIEDPSTEETDLYLRTFAGSGEDKIVLPTPDKIVRPYKKEEREERQEKATRDSMPWSYLSLAIFF